MEAVWIVLIIVGGLVSLFAIAAFAPKRETYVMDRPTMAKVPVWESRYEGPVDDGKSVSYQKGPIVGTATAEEIDRSDDD